MAKKSKKKNKKKRKKVGGKDELRSSDGKFKPGTCGNPNGRPKGSHNRCSIAELGEAIEKVQKSKKGRKAILVHFVERAYENDQVLISLMKKLMPDLRAIEAVLSSADSMPDNLAKLIQDKLRERYG